MRLQSEAATSRPRPAGRFLPVLAGAGLALAGVLGLVRPAEAGCGCEKPPPVLSQVRPNATYAGAEVALIDAALVAGAPYVVEFSGLNGVVVTVSASAARRRDLADGVRKPQLTLPLPALPLGPAAVRVRDAAGRTVLTVADDALTVVPAPVRLSEQVGRTTARGYRAAVGRDGTVYLSLDVSDVRLPRLFRAQALGYPLEFTSQGVVFFNTQGILMQLLDAGMPGLFSVEAAAGANSDVLGYSRHEFNTYFLQHDERAAHTIVDGHWHSDGTRHVDHDHLVVAIAGALRGGGRPAPGATPAFVLALDSETLFHQGLVATATGRSAALLSNGALVAAADTRTGEVSADGSVQVNGAVEVTGSAIIAGDLRAAAIDVSNGGEVTGDLTLAPRPEAFLSVAIPDHLAPLGALSVGNGETVTLAPGSYAASTLQVHGSATLHIDNCHGPVTLYVTGGAAAGGVLLENSGAITTCSAESERFAVYVAGAAPVTLAGGGAFRGVVYAPRSLIQLVNGGEFVGAFVGHRLRVDGALVHYDIALRGGLPVTADAPVRVAGGGAAPVSGAGVATDPADADGAEPSVEDED